MTNPAHRGWTSHGHPIPGATNVGPRPNRVARCGGTMLCARCKDEALRERPGLYASGGWPAPASLTVENAPVAPEEILSNAEWARLAKGKPQPAITVFTDTDDHEGYDNAVTQALTQSNGTPLHVQGPTRHVTPDRYMGGYTTRYAWTFTPHP